MTYNVFGGTLYPTLLLLKSRVMLDCMCVDSSWDEWVPESRVLKMSDASRQKQKELQNAHM